MAKRRDEMLQRAELAEQMGHSNIRTCKLLHDFRLILGGTMKTPVHIGRPEHLASKLQCYCKVGYRPEPFVKEIHVRGWDEQRFHAKGRIVSIEDELNSLERAIKSFIAEIRTTLRTDKDFRGEESAPPPKPKPPADDDFPEDRPPESLEPPALRAAREKRKPGRPRKNPPPADEEPGRKWVSDLKNELAVNEQGKEVNGNG